MTPRRTDSPNGKVLDLAAYRPDREARGARPPEPARPPLLRDEGARIAALCAAGFALGLLLAWLLDRLTGGPGLGVMLGL